MIDILKHNPTEFLIKCWIDTYSELSEPVIRNFFKLRESAKWPYQEWGYYDGDKLVGYMCIKKGFYEIELVSLYVNKDYQGKGIGSEFVQMLKDRHVPITLSVVEKNKKARGFYEKQGFTLQGEDVPFIVNGIVLPQVKYNLVLN